MKSKSLLLLLGSYLSVVCAWGQTYNVSIPNSSTGYTAFSDQLTLNPSDLNDTALGQALSTLAKILTWDVTSQSFVVQTKSASGKWTRNPTLSVGEGFYCIPSGTGISVPFTGTASATPTPIASFSIYPPTANYYLLGSQTYTATPPNAKYTYFDITGFTAPPAGVSLFRAKTSVFANTPVFSAPFTSPKDWNEYQYNGTSWSPSVPKINLGEAVWIGPRPCQLEGTVTDNNGNPVPNCEVSLSDGQFAFTDANGNYSFSIGSIITSYTVSVFPPCGWTIANDSQFVTPGNCPTMVPAFVLTPETGGNPKKSDLAVVVVYVNNNTRSSPYPCPNNTGSYFVYYYNKCGPTVNAGKATLQVALSSYVQYGTFATPGTPSWSQTPPASGGPATPGIGTTPLVTGNTLNFTLGKLPAGAVGEIQIPVQVSASVITTSGSATVVQTTATISPVATDAHPADNVFTCSRPARCAADPNSKIVEPEGCGPTGLINSQPLTYTIQFENDGSAPAFQVVVTDQLDPGLDPSTLQILGASANYDFNLTGNQMTFTFPNINLSDVDDDPAGSTGFISYQVQPLAGLADGTMITNEASIVFDENPPVLTDTTTNTITSTPMPSAGFTVTPAVGSADATNNFTYTGGSAGATFFWDFGPDAIPPTSTDMNPSDIVFPPNGLTTVNLQVSADGCTSAAASYLLNVGVPILNITPTDSNQFVLSWEGDGYSLQQSSILTNPVPWQSFSQPLTQVGATYFTPPIGVSNVTTFFRLTDQP